MTCSTVYIVAQTLALVCTPAMCEISSCTDSHVVTPSPSPKKMMLLHSLACALHWLRCSLLHLSRAIAYPFVNNHLYVESKIQLWSSICGKCHIISILLLRRITSHYFIFIRERLDIKFPLTRPAFPCVGWQAPQPGTRPLRV